jgi:hypothetical protein
MIQRIQTIYLLLALACMACIFAFNIASFQDSNAVMYEIDLYKIHSITDEVTLDVQNDMPAVILITSAIGLLLFTVLRYRNRGRQTQFARMSYILILLSVASMWWIINTNYWASTYAGYGFNYSVGFYLPFAAIAFTWLANRSIKQDEDLVRSLDRLR